MYEIHGGRCVIESKLHRERSRSVLLVIIHNTYNSLTHCCTSEKRDLKDISTTPFLFYVSPSFTWLYSVFAISVCPSLSVSFSLVY